MKTYTKHYDTIVDEIITDCTIYPGVPFEKTTHLPQGVKTSKAMWDTGATMSSISRRMIDALGLKPCSRVGVEGFTEMGETDTYAVHMLLPTGNLVAEVEVMETPNPDSEYDVVIGMDIISLGDMAFTNKDEKSVFSFRIPAEEHIEFQ